MEYYSPLLAATRIMQYMKIAFIIIILISSFFALCNFLISLSLEWEGFTKKIKKVFSILISSAWILILINMIYECVKKGYYDNGVLGGIIVSVILGYIFRKLNPDSKDDQVLKGTSVISSTALQKYLYGNKKAQSDSLINLGGIDIPSGMETQHFLFSGTTGSGKTQAINRVLKTIKNRGQKAIIADPAGGFYARFSEKNHYLLNPFDKRSVDWSPFAEIRTAYDCQRIAAAAIPEGTGDAKEWHFYARTLLAEVLLVLFTARDHSTKKLLYLVSVASREEMEQHLAGTPAAILTQSSNEKMLGNTRAIIAVYLNAWRFLPDYGHFSVRNWVQDDSISGWLFITYRDDQMQMLREFVAMLLDLSIIEGLSLSESSSRGLWFIFDEVDSLGKITSLRAALTKLRKYGGRVLLGLQTVSQLRTTYGKDEAQTLLSNTSIKLILRAGDNETADYFSKEIGDQEIRRYKESRTKSNKSSDFLETINSTTESYDIKRQLAVMPSEIMGLSNLKGFIKIPPHPVASIEISYENIKEKESAFI